MAIPTLSGDVYLMTFQGVLFDQRIISTFHLQFVDGPAGALYETACAEVFVKTGLVGQLQPLFLSCCPPAYTLQEVWLQRVSDPRVLKQVFAAHDVGTNAKDTTSGNVQATIVRRGDRAIKKDVGALRVPYPSLDTDAANGLISAAYQASLEALGLKMKGEIITAAEYRFVHVLFPGNGTLASQAVEITQTFSKPEIRTMRRRTVGRGI